MTPVTQWAWQRNRTTVRKFLMGATCALAATGLLPGEPLHLVEPANAIIGRPATPMSYAGVARRTTRRTVYATTAVVATTAPRQCYTRYDSYGRAVTTCY